MKVVVTGAIVVFLVFYIMTSPDQAANLVHSGWRGASNLAHGLSDFVNKLAE
jgi:NADH:ubiquinone oxidoreductase subunit 6 (subunit J)